MREWTRYQGKSRIACNGRCVMSQSLSIFYLTTGLIVVTSLLFFAFDCRFLAIKLSPAVPVFAVLQFFFVLATLFRTTFSDPGIIPRATPDEATWIEQELEPAKPSSDGVYHPPARMKDVSIDGRTFKLKFCFSCKIWRPPRASHCSVCDNCVERFDHHCPWVGNCVGRRNYRYFYLFLASLSIYCIFIMVFSVVNLVLLAQENNNFLDALKLSPPSVIVVLVAFFSIWSVVGLGGFHTLLICRETSTNEDIKGTFNTKRNHNFTNPFDRGDGCSNCCFVICGPVYPSLTHFTEPIRDTNHICDGGSNQVLLNGNAAFSNSSPTRGKVTLQQYGTTGAPDSPQKFHS